MRSKTTISEQLRGRRKQLGLSLCDVARRTGTSVPTLSRYENGWTRFEVQTLRKLSDALQSELVIELRPRGPAHPKKLSRTQVVRRLARLFWDHSLSVSDLDAYPVWIVERVLEYGRFHDLQILRRWMGGTAFLDAVSRARIASPKTRAFWEQLLEQEGRRCTRSFSRNTAWNY